MAWTSPTQCSARSTAVTFASNLDLDAGLDFYVRETQVHQLRWRNDEIGQAAVALARRPTPKSCSPHNTATNPTGWFTQPTKLRPPSSGQGAPSSLRPSTSRSVGSPSCATPFGNVLVLLDLSKGRYDVGPDGSVVGVTRE